MQLSTQQIGVTRAPARAPTPLPDANPALDPVVDAQARFRLDGSGPVAARTIVPVTAGAQRLLETNGAATRDALAGVLRLVEDVAGGSRASSNVRLDGVALSFDAQGHGANGYRSRMDGDATLHADIGRFRGDARAEQVRGVGERALATDSSTKANVVGNWIDLGPEVTAALLAPTGNVDAAAMAVRVLRHEAEHVVDAEQPGWNQTAAQALREVTAEAHATSLPQLARGRTALGLDGVVSDDALERTLAFRPYERLETMTSEVLRLAGMDPASPEAAELRQLPSREFAAALEGRLGRAAGSSRSETRATLERAFADMLGSGG